MVFASLTHVVVVVVVDIRLLFVIVGYICIHFKDPIRTPLSYTPHLGCHSFIPRLVVHCLNKLQFSNSSPQLNFTWVSNNSMALLHGCSGSLSVSTTHYSNQIKSTQLLTPQLKSLDYSGKLLPNKSCVEWHTECQT